MKKLFKLSIGANNQTGKLEKAKIFKIALNYYPEGFGYYEGFGVWKGGQEKSGFLEIISKRSEVLKLAKDLKQVLKQEVILIQELQGGYSFV